MFELLDPELQSTIFHVLIESLCSDMKPRENLIQIRSLSAEASKLEISSEERREYSVSRYGRPYSGVRLVKLLGNSIQITSLKSLHHVRTKTAA